MAAQPPQQFGAVSPMAPRVVVNDQSGSRYECPWELVA